MDLRDIDLDDNLKEHRRDGGRSGEEIERFTVDENLSDLDRTKLFLSPGAHQLQISCAVEKLPALFHEYVEAAYHALFPAITSCIESFTAQTQVAAGEAVISILEDTTLPRDVGLWLLPTALSMLNCNQSHDVLRVWLKALSAIIPMLPEKIVHDELMCLGLSKGESQMTVQSRTVCCTILGAIAPLLKSEDVEKKFLQRAMALCQVHVCGQEGPSLSHPKEVSKQNDTDLEVRVCMCEQLNAISRAVGVETTKDKVLPELFELLRDEEVQVQNAAFESLVQLLDFLPSDVRKLKIMPFLRPFVAPNDSHLLIALPRLFGELLCKMAPDLTDDDFQLLVDSYKILARHPNEEVRQLCASNFPAVVKCLGARRYVERLHVLYMQFVQDTSSFVRATIAASFHEIAKMLGKKRTTSFLRDPLVLLLEDDSSDVQKSILKVLQSVLGCFASGTLEQKSAIYGAMIPSLLHVEEAVRTSKQWRLQVQLLRAFVDMPEYLTNDQIYESLVPICFRYMAEGVVPVKTIAAKVLAIFIRNNQKASQRYELSLRVIKDYAQARSYWSRMVFIDFCENLLKVASSRMFKDSYLDAAVLTLHATLMTFSCKLEKSANEDPVPSVRMRACFMIPHLKYAIKLPEDVAILEKINHLTTQRLNDSVKEVAIAAQSLNDGLKHNLRQAINDGEVLGEQVMSQEEFDKIDKLREDEEWNMLNKEEQDEKKKLDEMLLRLKLDGGNKKSSTTVATGSILHPLSSASLDSIMRQPSKSIGLGRSNVNVGPRVTSVSSTTSRAQGSGDISSRGSISKAHRLSNNQSSSTTTTIPSINTSTHSTAPVGSHGFSSKRRDTSFVGTRSSTYRVVGVPGPARPASPIINIRPQTPSLPSPIVQDLNDHPISLPSAHLVGQRITPTKSSKTSHVSRRNSNT